MLAATFLVLYLNTDMFKSNQTLFVKYIGKNADNLRALESIINETEYEGQLTTNPYNIDMEATVNYTQNIGTTEENANNGINQLKLTVEGQTDNNNGYDYRNIKLLKSDEQVAQVEYLHFSNNYGVKFSDLFNQFLVSENTNLKELFRKMGYTDKQLQNIPDTVSLNTEFLNEIRFSDEELVKLEEKYVSIIGQNISTENFSKQSRQAITINGQNYISNAYVLTLTKEQLNTIYINLLQAVEQDETILNKIEILQNKIDEVTLGNNNINLKEELTNAIDLRIRRINQSNIGTDETRIIVYESDGQTLRTRIETQDYQINLDYLQLADGNFAELLIEDEETEKYKITLNYNASNLSIIIQDNDNKNTITFKRSDNINNQTMERNYDLTYEIDDKKVDVNVIENLEIVQNIENMQNFNNENAVMLNTLDDAQTQEIINTVRSGLDTEIETIKQEIVYQDIEQMLKDIGLMKNSTVLDSNGITETEKNRFNSNFELLQGENLENANVITSIQAIKNNIANMEIVSESELRLTIARNQSNEEVVNTLTEFLENNRGNKYNISVQYDENGLVNQLILTIVDDN